MPSLTDPVLDMLDSWIKSRHRRTLVTVDEDSNYINVSIEGWFANWMVWDLAINLKKYGVEAYIPDVRIVSYFRLKIPKLLGEVR